MDCKFAEKISLLIDGELASNEAENVKAHVAECSECRQTEKDFLYLRRQIKESASDAVWEARKNVRLVRPDRRKTSMWNKWISLPVPVFAGLLLLLAAFGAWTILPTINRSKNTTVAEKPTENTQPEKEARRIAQNEISLSRFDRGGRAEIYTTRRQPSIESEKAGSDKR